MVFIAFMAFILILAFAMMAFMNYQDKHSVADD